MKPNKVCSVYSIYNERATTGVNSMDKTHKANSILMKKGAIYLSQYERGKWLLFACINERKYTKMDQNF